MEVEIRTFDELIEFLKNNDLPERKVNEILMTTIQSLYTGDTANKKEMIRALKEFWNEWSEQPERPIFIDLVVPEPD